MADFSSQRQVRDKTKERLHKDKHAEHMDKTIKQSTIEPGTNKTSNWKALTQMEKKTTEGVSSENPVF